MNPNASHNTERAEALAALDVAEKAVKAIQDTGTGAEVAEARAALMEAHKTLSDTYRY